MSKFIYVLLFFCLLFKANDSYAKKSGTFPKWINPRFELDVSVGSSTNPAKLNTETSGTSIDLAPLVGLDFFLSKKSLIAFELQGQTKKYTESAVADALNSDNYRASLSGLFLLSKRLEFGSNLDYKKNKAFTLVESITGDNNTVIKDEYSQVSIDFFTLYHFKKWDMEFGTKFSSRSYDFKQMDRGNLYLNDFDRFSFDAKFTYFKRRDLNFSFGGKFHDKFYFERPSDLANGAPAPSVSATANLEEKQFVVFVSSAYKWSKFKFDTKVERVMNSDKITGARDYGQNKLVQDLEFKFSKSFTHNLNITYSKLSYEQFLARPMSSSGQGEKWEEDFLKFLGKSSYAYSKRLDFNFIYTYEKRKSNYTATYKEHILALGMKYTL
ncbi:hypothetical protein N9O57_00245 [bacterium]|nr:hypothetical protein [bacterium]